MFKAFEMRKEETMSEKVKRVLPYDYSAKELDMGLRMQWHPIEHLRLVDDLGHRLWDAFGFCHGTGTLIWSIGEKQVELPRIGDGHPRQAGDPYPEHWVFDPFTGERLEK